MNSTGIADNLRFLRQKNGYSLEDVAEIINVSRQTVGKWESAETFPDILNCIKLATLYRLSLDELVNRPLEAMASSDFHVEDGKICGVLRIDENRNIQLPRQLLTLFEMKEGDNLILLADKKQGIALVKCSQFNGE